MDQVVVIGDSHREHVRLAASRRQYGSTGDYDDDNWLVGEVSLRVSGFRSRFDAHLRSDDFVALRDALNRVHEARESGAWEPLEPWVALELGVKGDVMTVEGMATERIGYGNSLRFSFETSIASVGATIEQIDALLAAFPVPPQA